MQRWILSLLIASELMLMAPAWCQDRHPIDVENFEKETPFLWRGAQPSDHGLEQLAKAGVKTVIDLRHHRDSDEESLADCLGVHYFHIPLGYLTPSRSKVSRILSIITNPQYQPVFIHCRQGADRTGTVVALYRILIDHWTFDQAYGEMRFHSFKPWLISLKRTVRDCHTQRTEYARCGLAEAIAENSKSALPDDELAARLK